MIGRRFGRLVVLSQNGKDKRNNTTWLCQCDCGNQKSINRTGLVKGTTRSCGCLQKEMVRDLKLSHNLSSHRLHRIWFAMVQRCANKDNKNFPNYGGRGITVCEEWLDFLSFYKWANDNGYSDSLTIERTNNDGGYSPSNCVWATKKQQARNKRNVPTVEYRGELKTIVQLCEEHNIHRETFRSRIDSGWTLEDALTKPVRKVRKPDSLVVK
jgi:hypothetical protein